MKVSSLIQTTVSVVLTLLTILTIVLTAPTMALAEDSAEAALKTFNQAVDFETVGEIESAIGFYEKAIDQVLETKTLDIFIASKQHLANIEKSRGNLPQAQKLNKDADAVMGVLELPPSSGDFCGDCGPGRERVGLFCKPCGGF